MSVRETEAQVRDRSKTETRRLGWRFLEPGARLTLCPKVRGRRPGEELERLVEVEVTAVEQQRLWEISQEDVIAEGFPDWTPEQFVEFFCETFKVQPYVVVTVIRWRYPDA